MNLQRAKRVFKWILWVLTFLVIVIAITLIYNTIRSTSREASSIEELAPQTGKFVAADGVKVFYQEQGPTDGIPVILFHGTGS